MRLVKMISGWEYDGLTKKGRTVHKFKAGVRSYLKRRFRRRERHIYRRETHDNCNKVLGVEQ